MGSVLQNRQVGGDVQSHTPNVSCCGDDPSTPEMPLFRFRLKQLFGFMTVICGLFAVATLANVLTTLVVVVAVVLVAAHVCSTFLGFSLRAHADAVRESTQTGTSPTAVPEVEITGLARDACVPRPSGDSAFYRHGRSMKWVPALTLAGMVVGGVLGGVVLRVSLGQQISLGGIVVGALSLAVVGGWSVFLTANFYGIARCLWKQAMFDQSKDKRRSLAK